VIGVVNSAAALTIAVLTKAARVFYSESSVQLVTVIRIDTLYAIIKKTYLIVSQDESLITHTVHLYLKKHKTHKKKSVFSTLSYKSVNNY